jgi:putative membrane protein
MESLLHALLLEWPWRPLTTAILICLTALYLWGWLRSRRAYPKLATASRLSTFVLGMSAVALAMISPLYLIRQELLAARAAEQILLGIIAPPLIWLACPFHIVVWGMPPTIRKTVTRRLLLPTRTGRLGRFLTRPVLAWLGTLNIFLLWHDPQLVSWMLRNEVVYSLALWIFLGTYMLFWWHLVGTAPRIHPALPAWLAFFYIIVGGELPNMVTGMSIAFNPVPTYEYYAAQSSSYGLTTMEDQMASGGMIWVFGSIAYVAAAIIVLGRFFNPNESPPRLPLYWEASERSIAPGLEHRVLPKHLRRPNEYSN